MDGRRFGCNRFGDSGGRLSCGGRFGSNGSGLFQRGGEICGQFVIFAAENQQRLIDRDSIACADDYLFNKTAGRGFHLQSGLVGFDLENYIAFFNLIVNLNKNIDNSPFFHCLAKLRQTNHIKRRRNVNGLLSFSFGCRRYISRFSFWCGLTANEFCSIFIADLFVLFAETHKRLIDRHCIACVYQYRFYKAGCRGFHLQCGLVGFDLEDYIAFFYLVADFSKNIDDSSFFHCLAELRQIYDLCHFVSSYLCSLFLFA